MAFTGKQQRNGTDIGGGGEQNPMPGPMPDVAGLMSQSQSAAEVRSMEGRDLMASPQGSGAAGHEVGGYGAMFEWDAGLAIGEQPGEM
jgi:hypothetical protein